MKGMVFKQFSLGKGLVYRGLVENRVSFAGKLISGMKNSLG